MLDRNNVSPELETYQRAASVLRVLFGVAALATLCLMLSSCGGLPDLASRTVADLTQAKAQADAAGDKDASACYAALLPSAQSLETYVASAPNATPGLFTAFQAGRDADIALSGYGPVGSACAPLVQQTKSSLGSFLSSLGLL
jgi:hypothetical protein